MQRVAAELDFTKMSLYRYVPGKSELVALMIDRAMSEPPSAASPDAAGGGGEEPWRVALRTWAHALAAVYHRHPWLLGAAVGPRVMGPQELGWTERALAALADTGLTGAEQLDAVVVVSGHIRTIAQVADSMGLGSSRAKEPEQVMSAALNELLMRPRRPLSRDRRGRRGHRGRPHLPRPGWRVRPGADPGRPGDLYEPDAERRLAVRPHRRRRQAAQPVDEESVDLVGVFLLDPVAAAVEEVGGGEGGEGAGEALDGVGHPVGGGVVFMRR